MLAGVVGDVLVAGLPEDGRVDPVVEVGLDGVGGGVLGAGVVVAARGELDVGVEEE